MPLTVTKLHNSNIRQICQLKSHETLIATGMPALGVSRFDTQPITKLVSAAGWFGMGRQVKPLSALTVRMGYKDDPKVTLNQLSADLMSLDKISTTPMPAPLKTLSRERLGNPCVAAKNCFSMLMKEC